MMKKYIYIFVLLSIVFSGCDSDDDFMDKKPTDIFLDEQTWKSKTLIMSVMSDLYSRYYDYQQNDRWYEYCNFDEAYASTAVDRKRHQNRTYGYGEWASWDYTYIRHMNLFLQKCADVEQSVLEPGEKDRFMGEVRYLRAAYYFELAKRMGGVPLILEPLQYEIGSDPVYLQNPRKKESEIYDFVINEMDELKNILPNDVSIKSRATRALALATKSRAALYAGSIARYGALRTPEVSLAGGEVGINKDLAKGYYEKSLSAAQEIFTDNLYSLYEKNTGDRSENFTSLFLDKNDNPEVIFVKDYLSPTKIHEFTVHSIPLSMREFSNYGGSLCPSLNLVQQFELVNGNKIEPLKTMNGSLPALYENIGEIFAGRDPRLSGTIILPGSTFRNQYVDIFAGYAMPDNTLRQASSLGGNITLPDGTEVQGTGKDGPLTSAEYNTHTGFYIRKYNDTKSGSGIPATGSEVWFIRYRLAEVLLNAAEAAFELDNAPLAAGYINTVRKRAGFTTDLTKDDITFDRIVHERRVELAYEGHHLWDMKRWRIAHIAWDGLSMNSTVSDPAKADARNTEILGLWPAKVYNPSVPAMHGKWVFIVQKPAHVTAQHQFRMGNYYSEISSGVLSNNPKLVKQPNQ